MKRVAVAGLVAGASLIFAPVALAQPADPQVVQVATEVSCGSVEITLTNGDTGAYGFTYTVGPFDGGPAGESGRIDVAAGATVTRTVTLPEDSFDGRGFLTLGVAFGPNTVKQPFVDLGLVGTNCAGPVPPPVSTTPPLPSSPGPVPPAAAEPADLNPCELDTDRPGVVFIAGLETMTVAEAQTQVNQLGDRGIILLDEDRATPTVDINADVEGFIVTAVDQFITESCGIGADSDGDDAGEDDGDFDQVGVAPIGGVATGAR